MPMITAEWHAERMPHTFNIAGIHNTGVFDRAFKQLSFLHLQSNGFKNSQTY